MDIYNHRNDIFMIHVHSILQVVWELLYSTASAKDTGTLYAARNAINARKVTKSPSDDFYASSDLFEKFTIAIIICGALHYFKIDSLQSQLEVGEYTGDIGDQASMKEYIMGHAKAFVETYAHIHLPKLPDYGPQSNDLKCRYCQKQYQRPKPLRKHEASVHGHADPLYNAVIENSSNMSEAQDHLLNYTKLSLALGLLRLNQMDAIKYGDGERIMNLNQILYLFYKELGFPKYAYGMLETITQAKVLLSERMAQRLIWNRTVNHRGDRDSNHPNDLDLEHCNKAFKEDAHSYRGIFTEKTVSRVSHSALYLSDIAKQIDKTSHVFRQSGKHTEVDTSEDILLLVRQFQAANIFESVPGRHHQAYPLFDCNPFSGMNMENFQEWISESLKKFPKKHFYNI